VSILHDGERAVAEMSLDEITIPGAETVHAYELEVELLPEGTAADLDGLCHIFAGEYQLAPQPRSKFERAVALARIALPGAENGSTNGSAPGADATGTPTVRLPGDAAPEAAPPRRKKRPAGVLPTDSMTEAIRKVLRVQYEALLANKEGTQAGDDPIYLHDMRVATRRMRAALRIADPYVSGTAVARVRRDLRDLARAQGTVRDFDVLIEHGQQFRDALPADQQADMAGLLAAWEDARARARKRLVRLLQSREYRRLTKHMAAFLEEADAPPDQAGGARPYQVRHVVGSAIWAHYEAVRAYEAVMDGVTVPQLHALRIDGKYLRYTLEFFSEVLPDEVLALIRDVVAMQDQLGALHDADVAAGLVRAHLETAPKGKARRKADAAPPGLAAYLAAQERTVTDVHTHFATTWDTLAGPAWRARLAAVIAGI
jgi:CHAD domain-containing protein